MEHFFKWHPVANNLKTNCVTAVPRTEENAGVEGTANCRCRTVIFSITFRAFFTKFRQS
jgi:hypothetical protein